MAEDQSQDHSGTEARNPRSADLDRLPTEELLRVINTEDARVAAAVAAVIPQVSRVVDRTVKALEGSGRFLGFGAGTSGRLVVLDAVECLPTYGVGPERVQAFIAGGEAALVHAVEGAEDDPRDGAEVVAGTQAGPPDVVLAVSASGRTPWCLGVLEEGRRRGAFTAALTCNADTPMHERADVVMAPLVGPEVITGSTRMKAGTAQKLVLNMISTGVMVKRGRTFGNLMVGLVATNAKLQDRARRLVREITGHEDPGPALEAADYDVRVACLTILRNLSVTEARALLDRNQGFLRAALEAAGG